MKILLDECVNRKLKSRLAGIETYTVAEMNWRSLRNGNLMRAAIENKFDVLLTVDKNLEYQQNMDKYDIVVVVFDVLKNTIQLLETLVPAFITQMPTFEKGRVYRISKPDDSTNS